MKKEIIITDNYLLVVDDSEIKEGDCINDVYDGIVRVEHKYQLFNIMVFRQDCKKIIAHLPLNDSPILEGVMLLPPLEVEDDVWSLGLKERLDELPYTKHLDDGGYNDGQVVGFEIGAEWCYKKAREKYKFTEEDVLRIIDMSKEEKNINPSCDDNMWVAKYSKDELIQSLSQPKMPTQFLFEMELCPINHASGLKLTGHQLMDEAILQNYNIYKIKTTTNSQGQEVACGQYIYAS